MYKRIIVWAVMLFLALPGAHAQKHDFAYYDSLSYRLYQTGEYQKLSKIGKQMLKAGFDYYYLRMRLGIAAYEQKHYRAATTHFKKALEYNNNDLVKEYLYYSSLWGGESLQMVETMSRMPRSLRHKLNINSGRSLSADVELSHLFSNNTYPDETSFPQEEGYQIIPKSFTDLTFRINRRAGKNVILTHQFIYLHKTDEYHMYEDGEEFSDSDSQIGQLQYYLGGSVNLGNRWAFGFAAHLVAASYPYYDRVVYSDSVFFAKATAWDGDFLVSASVLKDFNRFSLEIESDIMNVAGQWKLQPSAVIRLYPFANLNLYTQSQFSWLTDKRDPSFFQYHKIGFKVFNYLWLEGDYFSGNVGGFSLNNGLTLFNGLEEVNSMWGITAIVPITSKLMFTFGYQNREQTNYFIDKEDVTLKSNPIKLSYSLIYISLKWKY